MMASSLDEIIIAADASRCMDFFKSMQESQRKELAPRAVQWVSALNGFVNRERPQFLVFDKSASTDIEFYTSIQSGKVVFPTPFRTESFPVARLAALATNGLPELKRLGNKGLPEPLGAAQVLMERKPAWLDKWCAYVLKEAPATHWRTLHALEKAGICTLDHTSAYWVSMLCSLSAERDLYDAVLSKEGDLREMLWDMLADPGVASMLAEPEQIAQEIFRKRWNTGGDIFATMQVGTRQGTQLWQEALLKLADEGLIDRNRLIDYSFVCLSGTAEKEAKRSVYQVVSTADFAIKLNEQLTAGETHLYASRFCSLLKATHKDVSTYASNTLASLPNQYLNVEDICTEIVPAFLNKSKEPAEAALKLLTRLSQNFSDQRDCLGPAILSAFSHSSKDIHKKALALVDSSKILVLPSVLAEFRERIDMILGIERANAMKLAAKYQKDGDDPKPVTKASSFVTATERTPDTARIEELSVTRTDTMRTPARFDPSAWSERLEALDAHLRLLAGVDSAFAACQSSIVFDQPVNLAGLDYPRLDASQAIEPISSLDDLIYMCTKIMSGRCAALDVEAMLDGISRLCHDRPPDFNQKTDALRQKVSRDNEETSLIGWDSIWRQVILAWLDSSQSGPFYSIKITPVNFLGHRCYAVAKRASHKQAAPLLAAPTHRNGWLDPAVLVSRLTEYSQLKLQPDQADFIQALLRLAPDNSSAALGKAAAITGEIGEALRYALGGADIGKVKTPEYWVAALRAREPQGSNEELRKLLPRFGPDGPEAAVYNEDLGPVQEFAKQTSGFGSPSLPNFLPVASADPNFPNDFGTGAIGMSWTGHQQALAHRSRYHFYPTVMLHDNMIKWDTGLESYQWLHNRESLLALYAKNILLNIESIGSYWHSEFDLIFDPDISMSANGRYLLCLAMSSKNNDLSRLAIDGLIAAVGERRISAQGYGQVMAHILPTGVITAVRWIRGLRDAAKVSALHAWFVWRSVGIVIAQAGITSTQQIPFLELLAEIQVEHQFVIDDTLRGVLSGITGSGKAAKIGKTLLSFSPSAGASSSLSQATLECLQSRLRRAERWQAAINSSTGLPGAHILDHLGCELVDADVE